MLAIFKGGHRVRGNVYEQKLYLQSKANIQNEEGKNRAQIKLRIE